MAQSRLEKIGTIYTRTTGLIKSGALSWTDRPLWYDVYEAFPPKEKPLFDRPAPNISLRKIFYTEDKIRALFHKNNNVGAINMFDNKYKTLTQKFIDNFNKLEEQYNGQYTEEQVYQEAIDLLKNEKDLKKMDSNISISTVFKEAQDSRNKASLNIEVSDVFKD